MARGIFFIQGNFILMMDVARMPDLYSNTFLYKMLLLLPSNETKFWLMTYN